MPQPGQLPYADASIQDAYEVLWKRHDDARQKQVRAETRRNMAIDDVTHATQKLAEVQAARRTNERARAAVEGLPAEAKFKRVVELADVEIASRQETLTRLTEVQQNAQREYSEAKDAADEIATRMQAVEAAVA